ncbi:RCC1 domain-containing protein [Bdellovibrio sp. HCB337]|uniref:RCC1 domain-containing protein n=1 Tax=Bdellovibrio sp. HCB337 TaxID=3394358 RepID=UPI0039A740EE
MTFHNLNRLQKKSQKDISAFLILVLVLSQFQPQPVSAMMPFAFWKPGGVTVSNKVIQIASGQYHTCALLDNSSVKCWGYNTNGQLGQGNNAHIGDGAGEMSDSLPAVNLGTGRTAVQIAAGALHTCALLDNSTVKCWGDGGYGLLGQGNGTVDLGDGAGEMGDSLPAINLGTGRTAVQIAAGETHNCALLDNSTVKCWGRNSEGQLGRGDVAHMGDGAGEMGDSLAAINLGTGRTVVQIATGGNHTCALLDNSTVKCWGYNIYGQLGQGSTANLGDGASEMGDSLPAINLGTGRTAVQILGGGIHTCALLDNSTVKCWGRNVYGHLGQGSSADLGDGAGEMGDSLPAINLGTGRTALQISAGIYNTCALLDNATVKCWGQNTQGQLGQGTTSTRGDDAGEMGDSLATVSLGTGRTALQIASGYYHNCALLDNSAVKCWGRGDFGQLGQGATANLGDAGGELGDSLLAINLGNSSLPTKKVLAKRSDRYKYISAGYAHSCAILDNSSMKCWGRGTYGQLGLGDAADLGDGAGEMGESLSIVNLGTGRTAVQVAAGPYHTCALLDNSSAKCWGRNTSGQLGQGSTANLGDGAGEMGDSLPAINLGTGRTALQVTVGMYHSCALLDNFSVKCWGLNGNGQLGQGSATNLGDSGGEMASLAAINLGTGRTALQVAAGGEFSCALLDNGTVKCWGQNTNGQLGQGSIVSLGDAGGEMGDSLPAINLGTGRTAVQIVASDSYACALLDNSSVKCWGNNGNGQLGQGSTAHLGDAGGEMGDSLPAINLGTGRKAVQISAGSTHACALLDNSSVKCWGRNFYGQLGQGSTANLGDGGSEMGDSLAAINLGTGRTAVQIGAGRDHTCALLENSTVKCWGQNDYGQLGQGSTTVLGDGAGEMGDTLTAIDLGQ